MKQFSKKAFKMSERGRLQSNAEQYGSFSSCDSSRGFINAIRSIDAMKPTEIDDLTSCSSYDKEDLNTQGQDIVISHTQTPQIRSSPPKQRYTSFGFDSDEPTMQPKRSVALSITSSMRNSAEAILQPHLMLTMTTLSFPDVPSLDRKASTFMTSMNILCLIQGVSTFAIPFVTSNGGLPVLISILILGISNWYGIHLISECQHQLSKSTPGHVKRVFATYLDIGAAVFPKFGRKIMAFINLSTALTSVSFFILIGQVTYDMLEHILPTFNMSAQLLIVLWACLVLPFLFIRRVSIIAKFSCVALFSMLSALIVCYAVLISHYSEWDMRRLKLNFNIEQILLGCGVINNSFFVHLIVPAIEGSMREPQNFRRASAASYGFNTLLKIGFGLLGTLTFGSFVQQSITSNLTSSMPILISLSCLIALNLFFSFPISLCVVFEMLDEYLLPVMLVFHGQGKRSWAWLLVSRLLLLLSVVLIAVSVPQFGLVVSFIGNVRGTAVALVLPIYFYLKLKWKHLRTLSKIFNIFLLLFYLLVGIGGAYFSLKAIIEKV